MVKKKKKKEKNFFKKTFEVKKLIKPYPELSPAQRRELVKRIAARTEIKPIKPIVAEPAIEPIEEMFPEEPMEDMFPEEPVIKKPLRIKSDILKHEEGSILTRNKNIFFKE